MLNKLYLSVQLVVFVIGTIISIIDLYNGHTNSRIFTNAKNCVKNAIGVSVVGESSISSDLIEKAFNSNEEKYFAKTALEQNCSEFFEITYYTSTGIVAVYNKIPYPIGYRSGLEVLFTTFCINFALFAIRRWIIWLRK